MVDDAGWTTDGGDIGALVITAAFKGTYIYILCTISLPCKPDCSGTCKLKRTAHWFFSFGRLPVWDIPLFALHWLIYNRTVSRINRKSGNKLILPLFEDITAYAGVNHCRSK